MTTLSQAKGNTVINFLKGDILLRIHFDFARSLRFYHNAPPNFEGFVLDFQHLCWKIYE